MLDSGWPLEWASRLLDEQLPSRGFLSMICLGPECVNGQPVSDQPCLGVRPNVLMEYALLVKAEAIHESLCACLLELFAMATPRLKPVFLGSESAFSANVLLETCER